MTGVMFLSGDAGKEEAVKGYAWAHVSMENGYGGRKRSFRLRGIEYEG